MTPTPAWRKAYEGYILNAFEPDSRDRDTGWSYEVTVGELHAAARDYADSEERDYL